MSGSDLRVPVDPLFDAFAVTATVIRDEEPIVETEGIWVTSLTEDLPSGMDLKRANQRRVLALRLDDVDTVPRGTLIQAPEVKGGDVKNWLSEGPERIEADLIRVIVVPLPA